MNRIVYRLVYALILSVLSVVVFGLFIAKGISGFPPAQFHDMIYGTAFKPYVHRALLPATVRLLTVAIPRDQKKALDRFVDESPTIHLISAAVLFIKQQHREALTEYAIALLALFLSLQGFIWSLRYLFNSLYPVPRIYADITCVAALAALPYCFKYYSHLYDFPTLFLGTLAMGLMYNKQWGQYLTVFVLACLNKETAILLVLLYAVYYRQHLHIAPYKIRLVSQVIIFLCIKTVLTVIFIHNPGSIIEMHLFDHNLRLFKLYPPVTIGIWLAIGATLAFLVFYRWSEKPRFLRDAMWMCIPLGLGILLFGFADELRVYYEVYPVIFLLAFDGLCSLSGGPLPKAENGAQKNEIEAG
jgi:hypothetical protein